MKLEELLKQQSAKLAADGLIEIANTERAQDAIREFLYRLGFTGEDGWGLKPLTARDGQPGIVLDHPGGKLPIAAFVTKGQYKSYQAQPAAYVLPGGYVLGGPVPVSSALDLLLVMQTKPAPEPAAGSEEKPPSEAADPLVSIAKSLQVIVEQGIVTRLP